jgi:trans-aconitate methyltransferase
MEQESSPQFVDWLDADAAKEWVDIGCGTGELTAQIVGKARPSRVVGIDMTEGFIGRAGERVPQAEFMTRNALDTSFSGGDFEYAVSGLVLNFIADKARAIREMKRIVRVEGTVGLYVWDYAGHMQIMRYFFDTAATFDTGSSAYDDGLNAPICRPGPLAQLFSDAGLANVETTALDITTPFVNFEDYWQPFMGGTGSAPKYCMSLDEHLRESIRDELRQRLPTGPDGEILLAARAWAVKGTVPG